METQHPTMARQIAVWVANADNPSARLRIVGATACESTMRPPSSRDPTSRVGILRQSTTLSGSAVTRTKTPNHRYVSRQPTVSLKCRNTGGQMVPPMPSPAVTRPTAKPRRCSNQRITLMHNGP